MKIKLNLASITKLVEDTAPLTKNQGVLDFERRWAALSLKEKRDLVRAIRRLPHFLRPLTELNRLPREIEVSDESV